MAIVTVQATDAGDHQTLWAVPPDAKLDKSPIPRGIRHYHGEAAVAALGSGDQTAVIITFTFPTNFIYLARNISLMFSSDDTTEEFDQFGIMRLTTGILQHEYSLRSEGTGRYGGTLLAERVWRPMGAYREWIGPGTGDLGAGAVQLCVQDMSSDTSTAGDIFWNADFWIYDIEQCMNYPANLFEQLIPYST